MRDLLQLVVWKGLEKIKTELFCFWHLVDIAANCTKLMECDFFNIFCWFSSWFLTVNYSNNNALLQRKYITFKQIQNH